MRMHFAVDNRGDATDAAGQHIDTTGLQEGILLPPWMARDVEVMYDWKPGEPVPNLLADCFTVSGALTVNLDEWIGSWIPPHHAGSIILDSEKWMFQTSLNDPAQLAALRAKFPRHNPITVWTTFMVKLVGAMVAWCRKNRPGCRVTWWGGFGWHPDQFDRMTDDDRAEMLATCRPVLLKLDFLLYPSYASSRGEELWPHLQNINLGECVALLAAAKLRGVTDVHLWHAIAGPAEAVQLQDWIDDVLTEAYHQVAGG